MKLIRQGAEAKLYLCKWNGIEVVKKSRIKKSYRNDTLDKKLRYERLRREIKIMVRARKLGIKTPYILHIIPEKFVFYMEYIKGRKAKEIIKGNSLLCEKIACMLAKLHDSGIIHGDVTLDNIIVSNSEPVFIDFGLGYYSADVEDRATDLLNLKRSMLALMPELEKEYETILHTYAKVSRKGKETLKRIREIEARARYVERV